ncbi:FadR/GntR family transcriptional regulator [Lysinibacillus xylanilyticus]|uniref:FadR/GntR family transcriptional regulator n=1 Tax=Lysinibacillus xylanilyticus TaxID=582475 RepID=UPI003CFDE6D2
MLEVRKIFEVGAAASAPIHHTEEDIKSMMQILDEMKQVQEDDELGEKLDFQFHVAISSASQNPLLATILNQVSNVMTETMKETRRIWLYSKKQQAKNCTMNIYKFPLRLNSKTKS